MKSTQCDWKAEAERLKFEENLTWPELTDAMLPYFPDADRTKVRETIRRYIRGTDRYKELHSKDREASKLEYRADGTIVSEKFITLRDGDELTPKQILKAHGLSSHEWEIITYTNNLWNTQRKDGEKQISYQSKVTARPRKDGLDLDEIDQHFAMLQREPFKIPPVRHPMGEFMAEVNMTDLHLGKLCWHGDTGQNYDYKIAKDVYYNAIAEICDELGHRPYEYITFKWADDFFNSDTITKTTTAGTLQDTDIRWQKLFNVGVEMLVRGIEALSGIASIRTFYTPSNHDETTAYHALKYLEAWFRGNPNVMIDTDAFPRKYQLYGSTLIGYCHGYSEGSRSSRYRASELASCMPREVPELWGQSQFREMHTAHLHSEHMIEEINGVIVRRVASPTALDAWHVSKGYGGTRKVQTFIYHKERGNVGIINTPVA